MQTYARVRNIEEGNSFPSAVMFSPDGQRIAVGGELGARIYTLDPHLAIPPLSLNTSSTISIEWNSDGSQIAIGTQSFRSIVNPNNWISANLLIFDAITGNEISSTLTAHETLTSISWNLDEHLIALYSADRSVIIWDTNQQAQLYSYTAAHFERGGLDYSPYGGQLALGTALLTIANSAESTQSSDRAWQFDNGLIQIIIPDPSLDRLQSIAELCGVSLDLQSESRETIISQVEALNIPPACRADLLAVAHALQAQH